MSHEKLAEALRSNIREAMNSGVFKDDTRRIIVDWYNQIDAIIKNQAAEAAQPQAQNSEWVMVPREPTQAMLDANGDSDSPEGKAWLEQDARDTWAAMLAAAPQPQAAEPVRQFRAFHTTGKWIDVKDREVWAVVTAHSDAYETRTLYTRPQQPAQDAKDAARYRHMIETSPFMCFGASEYHKKSDLDEAIDNSIAAMAKESGR